MMRSVKSIFYALFIITFALVLPVSSVSCADLSVSNDAGVDGTPSDGADDNDGSDATWIKPEGYASVTFFVDDTANRTYAAGELAWIGSFIYDPETNIATFDPNWAPELGSYPLLYDDGPISEGGHEMPGATAGDHIMSTEIYLLADAQRDMVYQYGLLNSEGRWIWTGPVGSFVLSAGSTERISADGFFIPAFGSYDLKIMLDTSQLNPTVWPFDPSSDSVDISGSMISWEPKQVFDDGDVELHGDEVAGDGVYTFVQSLNLGAHDGLLSAGQRVYFNFYINGVPYLTGQLPPPGVSALINCKGDFEDSAVFVQPDSRTGQFQSVLAVCDDRGSLPVVSVVPDKGLASGGAKVSIYGDGFVDGAQVMFGSKPAKDVSVVAPGLINCGVPASSTGEVDVRVVNPDGEFGALPDAFTFYNRLGPEVRLVSGDKGKTDGGDSLTIYGVRFADGASVTMGGLDASSVQVLDARRISCISPAHPAGKVSVCVLNPDGTNDCLDRGYEYSDNYADHDIRAFLKSPAWVVSRQGQVDRSALFARVFIDGVTQYPGCHQDVIAQLGWGPAGSDPSSSPDSWTWLDASCHGQCQDCGGEDEYWAWFDGVQAGDYSYGFRFRLQASPWVYADLWPGCIDGFQTQKAGYLRVLLADASVFVSSMNPSSASIDGGDTISLFGQGLSSQSFISMEDKTLESHFMGDQEIQFFTPDHEPGLVSIGLSQQAPVPFELLLPNAIAFVLRHSPTIDGLLDTDWPESYMLDFCPDTSDWGPNRLDSVYAAYDDSYLYLGLRAWVDPDASNAVVVYIDTDYGTASGVREGVALTDNTGYQGSSGLDAALSGRFKVVDEGFGAEFALGTIGMAQVEESEENPSVRNLAGLRDISDGAKFKWLPVTIKTRAMAPGDGMIEIAIPWESLNQAKGHAPEMHIALFGRIVNYDGEYQCSCGLPLPQPQSPLEVNRVLTLDVR